jgi:hypothetical protein
MRPKGQPYVAEYGCRSLPIAGSDGGGNNQRKPAGNNAFG